MILGSLVESRLIRRWYVELEAVVKEIMLREDDNYGTRQLIAPYSS